MATSKPLISHPPFGLFQSLLAAVVKTECWTRQTLISSSKAKTSLSHVHETIPKLN